MNYVRIASHTKLAHMENPGITQRKTNQSSHPHPITKRRQANLSQILLLEPAASPFLLALTIETILATVLEPAAIPFLKAYVQLTFIQRPLMYASDFMNRVV